MASLVKFDQSSHWYQRDGAPRHEANLRDARKSGLYASVTSIDKGAFPNPFLENWKTEQVIKACVDNQRMPHESVDQYAQRIYDISNNKARNAAEFGKELHDAMDNYPAAPKPELLSWYNNFCVWYQANLTNKIASEKVLLDHDIGVAGRTDIIAMNVKGIRVLGDWKSQDVKVDDKVRKKPNFYDSWQRQLAFYAVADAKESGMWPHLPQCFSLIIDSNPDGLVYEKWWEPKEMVDAYEDFVAGAWLWHRGRGKNGYWPNGAEWKIKDIQLPKC